MGTLLSQSTNSLKNKHLNHSKYFKYTTIFFIHSLRDPPHSQSGSLLNVAIRQYTAAMSSLQAPPSHPDSHYGCLSELNDESMARLEAACIRKRVDMILKTQRVGTRGFLSSEQVSQVIELVMDCQRAEDIFKQYSLAKIDKLEEMLSLEWLRYFFEAGLKRITASSRPDPGTINQGYSSRSQPSGVDATGLHYPWLNETGRIASSGGNGEPILNSHEDWVPASLSGEGQYHVQSADAQVAAKVCFLYRPVRFELLIRSWQAPINAQTPVQSTDEITNKTLRATNMTSASTAHLMATVNGPLQYDDLFDVDGIPHAYILYDMPSDTFYIIFCSVCHLCMHFGRNGTDTLEAAEKHFALRSHHNALKGSNSNAELAPDLSELYYRIGGCNFQAALENNVAFLYFRKKLNRSRIAERVLNDLGSKFPGEALPELRVQEAFDKCKAADQAARAHDRQTARCLSGRSTQNNAHRISEEEEQSAPHRAHYPRTSEAGPSAVGRPTLRNLKSFQ